jgi:hypothetical protein
MLQTYDGRKLEIDSNVAIFLETSRPRTQGVRGVDSE